jgi:hypothetical protein
MTKARRRAGLGAPQWPQAAANLAIGAPQCPQRIDFMSQHQRHKTCRIKLNRKSHRNVFACDIAAANRDRHRPMKWAP